MTAFSTPVPFCQGTLKKTLRPVGRCTRTQFEPFRLRSCSRGIGWNDGIVQKNEDTTAVFSRGVLNSRVASDGIHHEAVSDVSGNPQTAGHSKAQASYSRLSVKSENECQDGYITITSGNGAFEKAKNADTAPERDEKHSTAESAIDLMDLDTAGRKLAASSSYASVVHVNIEEGGVLNITDEDNNELFSGVGMDALVDEPTLLSNLEEEFSITTATHVQLSAIPRIQQGDDVVIQSHTGTGKTLAFLIPMLEAIDVNIDQVQAIVLAPTRELAMQISNECARLCSGTDLITLPLIGGANPARQIDKIRKRMPHVLIGTPGRIAELEDQRVIRLRKLRLLVVDEIDQCLHESFRMSVEYLLSKCPWNRQLVFASATCDSEKVREFVTKYTSKATLLRVGDEQLVPKNIENWYTVVPHRLRIETLRKLMYANPAPQRAMCFVDDPRRVDIVVEKLYHMRVRAAPLRGNAHKLERAEVLQMFRKGRISLLVTTEIAARGLDVPEVTHVFNLDLPTDADHYIHRAGRCGRAGGDGTVVNITTPETAFVIGKLQKQLRVDIERMELRSGEYSNPTKFDSRSATRSEKDRRKSHNTALVPGREEPDKSITEGRGAQSGSSLKSGKAVEYRNKTDFASAASDSVRPRNASSHKNPGRTQAKSNPKKDKKRKMSAPRRKNNASSGNLTNRAKREGWVGNRKR